MANSAAICPTGGTTCSHADLARAARARATVRTSRHKARKCWVNYATIIRLALIENSLMSRGEVIDDVRSTLRLQ
jgi:hypothetical protein